MVRKDASKKPPLTVWNGRLFAFNMFLVTSDGGTTREAGMMMREAIKRGE